MIKTKIVFPTFIAWLFVTALFGQSLNYKVEGIDFYANGNGVCTDCLFGGGPDWRIYARLQDQVNINWTNWNFQEDNSNRCYWFNLNNNVIWRNNIQGDTATVITIELDAYERDSVICEGDNGDCQGYTEVETKKLIGEEPCTWHEHTKSRICDGVEWRVRYQYFYEFNDLLPGAISDVSMASCNSFDPPIILNEEEATVWATYEWETSTDGEIWVDTVGATDAFFDPPSITETTYYRRRAEDCNMRIAYSNMVVFTVNVGSTPYTELVNPMSTNICNGESITLEVGGGIDGNEATTIWYDDANLNNQVATGNPFTTTVLTASQSYYVIRTDNCNNTDAFQVDVNVEGFPTPYNLLLSPNPPVVCYGQSAVIEVGGGEGSATTTTNWYTDRELTNMVGTGNPFDTPPLTEVVTYYVVRENYCAQTQAFEVNLGTTPDTDGDGLCDIDDADDDNDGLFDFADNAPLNPFSCRDEDNDGCDDCSVGVDGFGPLDDYSTENDGPDADGDGICDDGDDPICPDDVLLDENILLEDTVRASINITANNTIPIGRNIAYLAGEGIDLTLGFEVELGAEFYADIQVCHDARFSQSDALIPVQIISVTQNIQIIKYTLDKTTDITMQLFDNRGELKAARYHATNVAAGTYEQVLNVAALDTGIYICKFIVENESFTAKIYVD